MEGGGNGDRQGRGEGLKVYEMLLPCKFQTSKNIFSNYILVIQFFTGTVERYFQCEFFHALNISHYLITLFH